MKTNFPDYWGVSKNISHKKSEIYVLREGGNESFPELIEITFQNMQPISGKISGIGKYNKTGTEVYVLQFEGDERLFPEVLDVQFKKGKIVNLKVG